MARRFFLLCTTIGVLAGSAILFARAGDGAGRDALAGGATTIFNVSTMAWRQPAPNLDAAAAERHTQGDVDFGAQFVSAPSPVNPGLGPAFNGVSCASCHVRNGRARGKVALQISLPGTGAHGGPRAVPDFGTLLHNDAIVGAPIEARLSVDYSRHHGEFADGTQYTLRRPHYRIASAYRELPSDLLTSPRAPRPVFGLGLLEAVPAETIQRFARRQAQSDNAISGEANRVWNRLTGRMQLGRFGWKANQPTVRAQTVNAYHRDMGLTTPWTPLESTAGQDGFDDGRDDEPEVSKRTVSQATFYVQTLAVPARRRVGDPQVRRGRQLFSQIQCAACHQPTLKTGKHPDVPALSNQTIHPYTDLLLHDMGPALADHRPSYRASGREWRTPPLWGIGLSDLVNGHTRFLHDSRARNLTEAILWHGGEAAASRRRFEQLSKTQRQALIAFLESL